MDYSIYIILGALVAVYFYIFFRNKKGQKRRKSRGFMEGKKRHNP